MHVYVLTFYGGDYEDAWEIVEGVFTDEETAKEFATRHAYKENARDLHHSEKIRAFTVTRHTLDGPFADTTSYTEHLS